MLLDSNLNPFETLKVPQLTSRCKTFDPTHPKLISNHHLQVDADSERILYCGLSFDSVTFIDGYIEPCLPHHEIVIRPRSNSIFGNISTPVADTPVSEPVDEKPNLAVEVLPFENTDVGSLDANEYSQELQIVSNGEQSNGTAPRCSNTALNVERNLKHIVRQLRKSLKKEFDKKYGKKHYYWDDDKLRAKTYEFFTIDSAYNVPVEFYLRFEEVFFLLIHNTYDEGKLSSFSNGAMKHIAVTALFKDIFGAHPNKKNLLEFFTCQAIQFLWMGAFQHSKEFKQWKQKFLTYSAGERNKMFKYLVKIEQTAGFKILKE